MKTQSSFEIESVSLKTTLCVLLALSIAVVAGCASEGRLLMPTPVLYQQEPGASTLFADTPPERRTPDVELLFITDRATETNPESNQPYGEGRSRSLTFGIAVVEMVPGLTWSELEYQSRLPERTEAVNLELGRVTEAGRFPQEPYDFEATASGAVRSSAVLKEHRKVKTRFQDLMAHSRGSAVLLNTIRELGIGSIAAGVEPIESLKIDNVVLLAPDIDLDVAEQQMQLFVSNPDMITRWSGHRLPRFLRGRWTIYASPEDRALFVSQFLFRSRRRVGQLSLAELTDESTRPYAKWGKMDIVIYQGGRTDLFGHAYFATNPRVSSDLIQLIRYGASPGDPKRSLKKIGPVAWTFPGSDLASNPRYALRGQT